MHVWGEREGRLGRRIFREGASKILIFLFINEWR